LLILTVPGYGVPVDVVAQLLPESTPPPAGVRYVNNTDVSCQGHLPCHATIQAAVNAAQPGDTVRVQSGVYTEQVKIVRKNRATADETDRITLEADPDAPVNSVVLQGARKHCSQGYAILLQQSNFITIRSLTITGAGGQAISLLGAIIRTPPFTSNGTGSLAMAGSNAMAALPSTAPIPNC
jgi:hypothetical protein